jgi:hypothetical protein
MAMGEPLSLDMYEYSTNNNVVQTIQQNLFINKRESPIEK